MAKNQVELNDEHMEIVRKIAVKNGLPKNNQSLVDLALKMAVEAINYLDDESFENVMNLKK